MAAIFCELLAYSLARHRPHGVVDYRVGDSLHQTGSDGIPPRIVQTSKQSAIEFVRVLEQRQWIRILGAEGDETGNRVASDVHHQPLIRHEYVIPVSRDRLPRRRILSQAGPQPLIRMTVIIADEKIEQARRQERARIHLVPWVGVDAIEEILAIDDLVGAGE